uniref:Tuftelin n=1 Tax=Oncorhynchus tshawytscha TaxID=74940 RepID=A0AAZ3PJ91_ONCTS
MVQAHQDSREEGMTKPIAPQEIWHGSSGPQKVLQLHHREHPDRLHHCLVWQLLGLRPQDSTEGSVYSPVHHWGQASCHPGPLYQAVSEEGPKNCQAIRLLNKDSAKIREVSKRLYAQLKESEKRHKEERDRMQAESDEFSRRLDEQSKHLQWVEGEAGERGQKVEDLQRLLGGMELEGAVLRGKIAASEADLLQLRAAKEGVQEKKTEELEKELAVLKEKIHHLDDMLKSQQRKVRHMIEQLQNSRTVIQERERVIRDLEEKVAFLEAENTEMRDQIEYFLEGQKPASPPTKECKPTPQIIYR